MKNYNNLDLELKKRIDFAYDGLSLNLSKEEIFKELMRSVYYDISKDDLKKTIILNSKHLIELDADFSKFAARILLSYIYEEVLEWNILENNLSDLDNLHKTKFKINIKKAIEINRISSKILEKYNIDYLSSFIDFKKDFNFEYIGIQTLYDRYLIINKENQTYKRLEVPQFFWMRVSMGIFINELNNREEFTIKLYNLYINRKFCSSTPTLFNSGTNRSQLSSCYLFKVDDSLSSIMTRGIAENAYLSKWAGGLGGSWTSVRGTGSFIKGTNGESQGVIPFLKLFNDLLVAVNQGGKRRGAGCSYLETWHNDIEDFIELRRNTGDERRRTHDMNTANWIPDLFMKRMEQRKDWTLFRSSETPDLHELYGKEFEKKYIEYEIKASKKEIFSIKISAITLWKKMLSLLFETGHPWITFKDPSNICNTQSHKGVIHSSNLCTEIILNTSKDETAVCNLGSIVLDSHIDINGNLDTNSLRNTIKIAIRALDNIIDINFYPTDAAKVSNTKHRPIGLGIMGLQNSLYLKNISFASEECIEFNDEFMEKIAYYAYEASSDLALERGSYDSYKGSKWDLGILPCDTTDLLEKERELSIKVKRGGLMDWTKLREKIKKQGMRNSNVLAIAPTATISNIMGTTPSIEPSYNNIFVKSNLSGDFIILNNFLIKDLKKINLWNLNMLNKLKEFNGDINRINIIPNDIKLKYITAFDVDYKYIIDSAARRQKWIDQSQSLNLFLKKSDLKTLSHMYRYAWHAGLKTTYYLRTLSASNIEGATFNVKKELFNVVDKEFTCDINNSINDSCESCQ